MKDQMTELTERDDLLVSLPPMLMIAGTLTTRAGNNQIFAPFDLTVHHYAMLQHVLGTPCKMAELKDVMFNSAANVTQHVDALEQRGLLRRVPSPGDRRVTLIEITDSGRELLQRVEQHYLRQMKQLMWDYGTLEMRQIAEWLRKFIADALAILERDEAPSQMQGVTNEAQ